MKNKRIVFALLIAFVCLNLTACKSCDYKAAIELEEAGNYADAAIAFEQLGDYKDAATHLSACNNQIKYAEGISLQESKKYAEAAEIYEELGSFEDAPSRLAECTEMVEAIDTFDVAKEKLQGLNQRLDDVIKAAEEIAYSGKIALNESLKPELENVVSEAKATRFDIPSMPENADEIIKAADEMDGIDYSNCLKNIENKQAEIEKSIKQYELVDNPKEGDVIARLKAVPGVLEIAAATEDNDPNNKLGKAGGYTAAIYFTHENVDPEAVAYKGSTVIEKGTDGGGQLEVYATVEDAQKRDEYLASFDGSIFASGSHSLIGTILVRTSDELKASQQKELEANIIEALTKLD